MATEREIVYRLKVVADPALTAGINAITAATTQATPAIDAAAAAVENQSTALAAATQNQEALTKATVAGQQQVASAIEKTLSGTIQLARAAVLVTAANAESAESALRVVARFEASVNAIKGMFDLIEGATKLWETYTATVEAAAAAQAALATAEVAGAAGGAAGAARGGSTAANAAGGGVGLAMLGPLVVIAAAITAILAGIASLISSDFRAALLNFIGVTDIAADAQARLAEQLKALAAAQKANAEMGETKLGFIHDTRALNAQRAGAMYGNDPAAALADNRAQAAAIRAGLGVDTGIDVHGDGMSDRLRKQELEELFRLETEALRLSQRRATESLDAEKKQLEAIKTRVTAAETAEKAAKEALKSTAERVANLDPSQASALSVALDAVKRGQKLSVGQANALGALGDTDASVKAAREEAFTRAASSLPGLAPLIAELKRKADETSAAAGKARAEVTVQAAVVAKLEASINSDDIEKSFRPSIDALVKEMKEVVSRIAAEKITGLRRDFDSANLQATLATRSK